jgi:hypothetical protein
MKFQKPGAHGCPALSPFEGKLDQKVLHWTDSCQPLKAKDSILSKYFALKSTESQALKIARGILQI